MTSVYLQGMVHAIRFDALRDKRACSFVEVADGRAATEPAGSPRPPRSQMPRRELCATPRAYQSVWRALVPRRFLPVAHSLLTDSPKCAILYDRGAGRRQHFVSPSLEPALHHGEIFSFVEVADGRTATRVARSPRPRRSQAAVVPRRPLFRR